MCSGCPGNYEGDSYGWGAPSTDSGNEMDHGSLRARRIDAAGDFPNADARPRTREVPAASIRLTQEEPLSISLPSLLTALPVAVAFVISRTPAYTVFGLLDRTCIQPLSR